MSLDRNWNFCKFLWIVGIHRSTLMRISTTREIVKNFTCEGLSQYVTMLAIAVQ